MALFVTVFRGGDDLAVLLNADITLGKVKTVILGCDQVIAMYAAGREQAEGTQNIGIQAALRLERKIVKGFFQFRPDNFFLEILVVAEFQTLLAIKD